MAKKKKTGPGRDGNKIVDVYETEDPAAGGEFITRQRAIGHDTIRLLQMRGTLEQYHVRAGLKYLDDFERATIGISSSSDPVKISGSPHRDLSYVQLDAIDRLKAVHNELRQLDAIIIRLVCIENIRLPDLQKTFAGPPFRWPTAHYTGPRVREAFEELSKWYFGRNAINTD